MNFSSLIITCSKYVWGLPLLVTVFLATVFVSFMLRFVQFRYFFTAVNMLFGKDDEKKSISNKSDDLTSFQAFINTLGANIGNGSLAGIPVAICAGGPGAIFWLIVMSTFAVALRYAEVYLGMIFIGKYRFGSAKGGPMLYLSLLPGIGYLLAYTFALFCFGYELCGGNLLQCNSIGVALQKTWAIDPYISAFFVLAFIVYILLGGAQRIVTYLDMLVPFKVFLFISSSLIVITYYYQQIPHAFYLIFQGAFYPQAFIGGTAAYALQRVMTIGLQRSMMIHEAGLGTAAVAFGSTTGKSPVKDSILSMLSVYINTHVICLLIALTILVTGVWDNGETSTALVISAYQKVFGSFGGWIISFLSINFALSVLVSAAYVARVCWSFLTGGRFMYLFPIIYGAGAFFGTYTNVALVWSLADLVNAGLLLLNIIGLVWFIGTISSGLRAYEKKSVE